jgi:hypothetical protein
MTCINKACCRYPCMHCVTSMAARLGGPASSASVDSTSVSSARPQRPRWRPRLFLAILATLRSTARAVPILDGAPRHAHIPLDPLVQKMYCSNSFLLLSLRVVVVENGSRRRRRVVKVLHRGTRVVVVVENIVVVVVGVAGLAVTGRIQSSSSASSITTTNRSRRRRRRRCHHSRHFVRRLCKIHNVRLLTLPLGLSSGRANVR